ncbi:MAG: ATP-binding cassette domain-containing protein [Desulfotignum sp.]
MDFDIFSGDRIALVGQNGSGKTTLIKLLSGLLAPAQGEVLYKGKNLANEHLDNSRLTIGVLFQDPDDQLFGHTVMDDVAFGPRNQGKSREAAALCAKQALHRVNLEHLPYKEPHNLSYGQKKRVALAGILAMEPEVLILDEPTAGLDPRGEKLLMAILETFGKTLLLVSHDLFFIEKITQRTVVMHQGRVLRDLPTPVFMQDDKLRNLNGLSFSYRQRSFTAIQKLQHEHEHRHPHRHIHEHEHRHDQTVHTHPHEHLHDHPHRFVHTHPGGQKTHDHARRLVHDHEHPGHDAENHDHPHG